MTTSRTLHAHLQTSSHTYLHSAAKLRNAYCSALHDINAYLAVAGSADVRAPSRLFPPVPIVPIAPTPDEIAETAAGTSSAAGFAPQHNRGPVAIKGSEGCHTATRWTLWGLPARPECAIALQMEEHRDRGCSVVYYCDRPHEDICELYNEQQPPRDV